MDEHGQTSRPCTRPRVPFGVLPWPTWQPPRRPIFSTRQSAQPLQPRDASVTMLGGQWTLDLYISRSLLAHRCTYHQARPWQEVGGRSARARTTTSRRAPAIGCLPKTMMATPRAMLLEPRAIGCRCPSRWLGTCAHATGPCHGPMPTSRRGGFSTAGACRFLPFPAKVRSGFQRSCGSVPCSRLTCGVTQYSPSRPRVLRMASGEARWVSWRQRLEPALGPGGAQQR
jgi:hypothetical protein